MVYIFQLFVYSLNINLKMNDIPYYYNPKIHNFGNIGLGGKIHANLANFATKQIDNMRYNNINIRKEIYKPYIDKNYSILDLCCGIGISTAPNNVGIDTSLEMLDVAKQNNIKENKKSRYYFGNAEDYITNEDFDIVTCMFAFHEMPLEAQLNIIKNGKNIAKKEFIIVDIAPDYKDKNPPKIMLSGEPYLMNYLNNINEITKDFKETILIPKHVHIWKYIK